MSGRGMASQARGIVNRDDGRDPGTAPTDPATAVILATESILSIMAPQATNLARRATLNRAFVQMYKQIGPVNNNAALRQGSKDRARNGPEGRGPRFFGPLPL